MNNNTKKPYVCPNCNKAYPLPPKACSCESFETIEKINYYFLLENPENLVEFESVTEMDAEKITEDEFMNPTMKGFYIEETYLPGIETIGSFSRIIKKKD